MRSVSLAAILAVLALTACGGSAASGPNLSAFTSGFTAEKASFRQLGLDLQKAITGARAKTDAQLAAEIGALSTRASQQAMRLSRLEPTTRFKADWAKLVAGFQSVAADLRAIAAAAVKHDAATARTASETLLADAAKVKTADDAISRGLGLSAAG